MIETLWTSQDVADYLKVSIHTVRAWQGKNRIPFVRLNGAVRYVPEKVKAWVLVECAHGPAV